MPDDPVANQEPPSPVTFDEGLFDQLREKVHSNLNDAKSESRNAFDRSTELNKQISAIYEKLLLLNLGTIGLSISALIGFTARATFHGWHKGVAITLITIAWLLLLVSSKLCGGIMFYCLAANRKLLSDWLVNVQQHSKAMLRSSIVGLGGALKGTIVVDEQPRPAGHLFETIADLIDTVFEKSIEPHKEGAKLDLKELYKEFPIGEQGKVALRFTQLGLLLLGATAVFLFAKM